LLMLLIIGAAGHTHCGRSDHVTSQNSRKV
jgi:hypothetical protein